MKTLPVLILTTFFMLSCTPARAQDDPQLSAGFMPYGSFHSGEIDSVNLANGNVIFHAPLIAFPQRGGAAQAFVRIDIKPSDVHHPNLPADMETAICGGT